MRKIVFTVVFLLVGTGLLAGEGFSWTNAPASGNYVRVNLNPFSLAKYLTDRQVNRPEIVNEVKKSLEEGRYYRKTTKDQKGTATTLTVFVDPTYMMHIITYRNEPCPSCNGTGTRAMPFDQITTRVSVQFRCLDCDGEGVLKNHTVKKNYLLSSEDFENPEEGRQIFSQRAFANAPDGAEVWIERLASANPRERLEACLWLDKHYVRDGVFFQDIMPMLKKARYYDSNEKKRIMVWQFWAGKDMPEEKKRAYYRVYADTKTGKVTRKGFFPAR